MKTSNDPRTSHAEMIVFPHHHHVEHFIIIKANFVHKLPDGVPVRHKENSKESYSYFKCYK